LLKLRKSDCSTLVSSIHIASLELLLFGKPSQQHARQIPLSCNRATNTISLTCWPDCNRTRDGANWRIFK